MTGTVREEDPRRRAAGELLALVEAAEALAASASSESLRRPPARGGWSALQCLEHLSATAEEGSRRLLAAAGAPGRRLRRPGVRWWVRLFARSLEPPARFRTRTSASFDPAAAAHALDPDTVVERFRAAHQHLADDVVAVADEELHRVSVDSPFGPVRYTPFEWAVVLAAHARRHVWQARRAVEG